MLQYPKKEWSATADFSVKDDMTQEKWEEYSKLSIPKISYWQINRLLAGMLSKLDKLPTKNILQDMQTKKSFHIHDWNRPNREFLANLRALPPPPPPP